MSEFTATDTAIPTKISGPAWLALAIVMGTLLLGLGWAATAPLNSGSLAAGVVIPDGRSKLIQHLDGGIIAKIAVHEGDEVRTGAPLMVLDDADVRAQVGINVVAESTSRALVQRLEAERDGVMLPPMSESSPSANTQVRLFEIRRKALSQEIGGLKRRMKGAEAEMASWKMKNEQLASLLDSADEESKINRSLYERNFIAKPRLLQLESRRSEIRAAIAENEAEMARARQKITEAELAISKLEADWMNGVLEELRRAQEAQAAAAERLLIARGKLERTTIRAPIDGVVNELRFVTVGGVIPPGATVAEITPNDKELMVEGRMPPDDINSVQVGQSAKVRLSAYRNRWLFSLNGEVVSISSDTFQDERDAQPYYRLRVRIPPEELEKADGTTLIPGMIAEIEIVTGERTALQYLLDPLVHSFRKAMLEE